MKTLAIIDIDGTITNFYKVDSEIISRLYGTNRFVRVLDRFLWKINSLDIITNRFVIFKLRMCLYSLLSRKSYKVSMKAYKMEYIAKVKAYFQSFMESEYVALKAKGIDVLLLTCDPFDGFCGENVTVVQNKFRYVLDNVSEKYDIVYIIGNNYMDDIKVGLRLRSKVNLKSNVEVFYVGSSSVLKGLMKNKGVILCENLEQVIKMIC